jgi:tetratricopeptide (TPR) repeat protein
MMLTASAASAQAEPASGSAASDERTAASLDREARALFEAGREAMTQGRYESALAHFREAYDASGRPELLYNIAVAADRLRRDADALEAYRGFLASLGPGDPNRVDIERRVEVLEGIVASEAAETDRRTRRGDGAHPVEIAARDSSPPPQRDATAATPC